MTQPQLSASFRLNAPHVDDDEVNQPTDLRHSRSQQPQQQTTAQPALAPDFRLNAPHVDSRQQPQQQTTTQSALGPDFRLNAPHVEDESLEPTSAELSSNTMMMMTSTNHANEFGNNDIPNTSRNGNLLAAPSVRSGQDVENQKPKEVKTDAPATTASSPADPQEEHQGDGPITSPTPSKKKFSPPVWCTRKVAVLSGIVVVVLVLLIVLLSVYLPEDSTSAPSKISTKTTVKSRGTLRCGVGGKLGFSTLNKAKGRREGFEVDLCRAIGAALFEADGHTEYTVVTSDNQFSTLQSGAVDLLVAGTTYTIQSDVFEPSTSTGFTFSLPYFYSGLSFAGLPQYVACAEARQTTGNCANLTICVQDVKSYTDTLKSLLPNFQGIKLAPTQPDLYYHFKGGLCKVIAGEGSDLIEVAVTEIGYTGPYNVSLNQYSKEPLSLVTRDDDAEWSDFVNWVIIGLLSAEKENVTQNAASTTIAQPSPSFDMSQITFYHAVAAVGNYGEVYERNLGMLIPRAYANMQNQGSPLITSIPLGDYSVSGPGPTSGGTLEQIAQRGSLRCGVAENAFFSYFNDTTQQWSGFDIDFCRAISAALFGPSKGPEFVQVTAANRFQELAKGNIDIISRTASVTYQRDVLEETTGKGFSFSQPYFYSGVQFGGIPPYVQCADNIDVTSGSCPNLLICVTNGTTTLDVVKKLFLSRYIIPTISKELTAQCLAKNQSNVIAGNGFDTANVTIREVFSGSYEQGTKLFTRDNLAIVTNQGDAQWSSFVSLVVTATIFARENGYSKATFRRMPTVNLFGPSYGSMLRNAIQAVGSYGEMYGRSAGTKYPRAAINNLSTVPYGPQHYPPPGLFGLV